MVVSFFLHEKIHTKKINTTAVPTFATGGTAVCGAGWLPVVLPLPAWRLRLRLGLGLGHLVVRDLGRVSPLRPLARSSVATIAVSHALAIHRIPWGESCV